MKKRTRSARRLLLGGMVLAALASPMLASSGCGSAFDSISQINGLRVLTVVPAVHDAAHPTPGTEVTGSYANPGDEVTFTMSLADNFVDPARPSWPSTDVEVCSSGVCESFGGTGLSGPPKRPLQILWLAGCFDPPNDAYYACYPQLADVLASVDPSHPTQSGLIGFGPSFKLKLPDDLISRRTKPEVGPYYGIAYVFFAVCAGTLGPVAASGDGKAGSFPLGCFDANGNQLGADSFVPGYTQIYTFDDGRQNQNPKVERMTIRLGSALEGNLPLESIPDAGVQAIVGIPGDVTQPIPVERCDVSRTDRKAPPTCDKPDPVSDCNTYSIDVDVGADVAEIDPDSTSPDGEPLHEVVWVDYFADKGDFETEVKLVSDATTGLIKDHSSRYIPPAEPGLVRIWTVVHDARGGSTVLEGYLQVE